MRRDKLYLLDIAEGCTRISSFLGGKDREAFLADEILFDAVVRNIQNIGEAVRSLPPEIRDQRPDIKWKEILGLRHLLVHHYFGVDQEIVWDIASNRCPELLEAIEDLIGRTPDE